jgi:hypothetical protein
MDFILLLGLAALAAVLTIKGVLWAKKQDRSGERIHSKRARQRIDAMFEDIIKPLRKNDE